MDLGRGLVGLVDTSAIRFEDESACMGSYIDAQKAWVPMPEVNGLSAPGYTMTARIFRTPEYDAGGTPGIAIVFVQGPDDAELRFRRKVDGVWLAAETRVYLDALRDPRRGAEQAREYRNQVFGF